jgi:hypothetical protein
VEPAPKGVELFVGQGEDLYVVTLANYYLDDDAVTLNVALPEGKALALAYDAEARRKAAVRPVGGGAFAIPVPLDSRAVKVIVLRLSNR